MHESAIEQAVCDRVGAWASVNGIGLDIIKLNITGRRGYPDRMFLVEGGSTIFVEFKKPGEKPRKMQTYVHEKLTRLGFSVLVHDNIDKAVEELKCLLKNCQVTTY